jgi:aminoglycoside phosphotransferase
MNPSCSSPVGFASDVVFPQRDTLLNPSAVARYLASQAASREGEKITRCERFRVKYRVGESLRVLYRLSCQEREYLVSARAFPPGKSAAAYGKVAGTAPGPGPLPAVAHAPDLETVFWTFPNDRKLARLSVLVSPPASCAELVGGQWSDHRLVAYAPEKGATVQCLNATGEVLAYAKMYAEDENARSVRNHCSLYHYLPTDDPYLGLPRVLGYVAPYRLLFIEPQYGQRLTEVPESALPRGIKMLGTAVARFHQLPPPPVVSRFTRLDCDQLIDAARLIGQSRPDVADLATELAELLLARHPSPRDPAVCLHGDVHGKNGIVQNDRVALIDFDQVALGPAAAEIGSFLAGLHYWCCIGRRTPEATQGLVAAFRDGYATVAPLPSREEVRWHIAAALLAERAHRAVNRIREYGLLHLPQILAHARALVTGGHHV